MPTPVGRQYGALPTSGPTRRPRRALPGPAPEAPRAMRPELMLAVAIAAEIVATTSLKLTEGFTKPLWSLLVVVGYGTAFWMMSQALKTLPLAFSYAIWSGVGIAGTALLGLWLFGERLTLVEIGGILLIVAGIVVLNLGAAR